MMENIGAERGLVETSSLYIRECRLESPTQHTEKR